MATASEATATAGSSGTINSKDFPDFLATNFQKVFSTLHDKVQSAGMRLYRVETDGGIDEPKFTSFVGFRTMPRSDDDSLVPWGSAIQGFDLTMQTKGYRLGYRYADRLRRVQNLPLITRIQRALITSSKDTIEEACVEPWNKAFSATVPFIAADGMNLCDTSRPLENGQGTWDNEDTSGALTQDTLEQMDINFADTTNGQGLNRGLVMARLVVPTELKRKAKELRDSDQAPEDALNSTNVYKGEFSVDVQARFTSATAWFGTCPVDDDYGLIWMWGLRPSVKAWTGDDPDVTKQRIKMEFDRGATRVHGIRGNAGT